MIVGLASTYACSLHTTVRHHFYRKAD